ncbi:multidrug and toxin extrusion protein 1-like [Thalassophryne amazonica]|uniref:multidrug and toxin extrusion protein 1-like n=1 Tax=Thalassophryne amazonica TaxID=390379 RepID=UPI001471FD1D|nr:multidrug and toxin extrusion protein 1-like [Thalassophryne amazonica]
MASHPVAMETSSAKLSCCRWVWHRVPQTHREELQHILSMTGPLMFSRILNYLLPFVVTMFCGRLGNEVMAGYGLASATINVTTAAPGYGLALACDTLVSQTFGGKNLQRVGVILQRGVVILLLFCLPCWALLINAQPIFLCLGQDPDVARIAQLYITAYLPAVPVMFLHHLQASYLQNQSITLPQMYAAAIANVLNVATNYVFLQVLGLGVSGSAAANTLSQVYICALLFGYIRWKKLHTTTWGGWTVESLQEWGSYMNLAVPSSLMKCFEWWVYEFGSFFAGMLSEDELAAQHAVIMVSFITYMFPLGVQAAACARVGNALGAGDTARAIITSKLSLSVVVTIALLEGLLLSSTKTVIGFIFSSDQKIIGLISNLMNVYCILQLFDGLVCVCTGIFLGSGKQKIPAVANLIGYYGIGLPMSMVLMFVVKLRGLGYWLGLLICVCLQSTFYIIVIFKLNWKRMTEEAVKRAQKNTNTTSLSTVSSNSIADQMAHSEHDMDADVSVSHDARDLSSDTPCGHVAPRMERGHLSTNQLLFRRGLTVCAAAAVLAVGASLHVLLPVLETPSSSRVNFTTNWINATHPPD